jgi:hypothetical protein
MNHLIIGQGEVGQSLQKIFECDIHDIHPIENKSYDIIHITFPYSKKFNKYVRFYQKKYSAKYTVIHSTVPLGTSKKLKSAHSPVTGVHPYLEESIKTFTKFIGGENSDILSKEFIKYGIPAISNPNSNNTEAGKLYNLLTYGINILIEKEIYSFCKKK